MDKCVILAVAGSGKTTHLVRRLQANRRTLVVTYTENNLQNLRAKILEEFQVFPANITLSSYFSFLYSFCFLPFLWCRTRPRGMRWSTPPQWTCRIPRDDDRYYFDAARRVYHNRLARLLEARDVLPLLNARVERYFDELLIDEIQDFAGHDFNLLAQLTRCNLDMCFVGDFYQHTYDTSRDGNVNCNLHHNINDYTRRFEDLGLTVERDELRRSYRCSPTLCAFVKNKLGIDIRSQREDSTTVRWINSEEEAKQIHKTDDILKLFYQSHQKYCCRSNNWGAAKGLDFQDVAVVLNQTSLQKLQAGRGNELRPQTRNKLYVACTRASGSIYLVPEHLMPVHRE